MMRDDPEDVLAVLGVGDEALKRVQGAPARTYLQITPSCATQLTISVGYATAPQRRLGAPQLSVTVSTLPTTTTGEQAGGRAISMHRRRGG
jgi:hypothetical protein